MRPNDPTIRIPTGPAAGWRASVSCTFAPRGPRFATWSRGLAVALLLGVWAGVSLAQTRPAPSPALEAVRRLKGVDLESNPALKGALLRVLETTRGTPDFVELVRDFGISGQTEGLIEVAAKNPGGSAGAEAMRLVLARGGFDAVRRACDEGDDARRTAMIEAIASLADPEAVPLLLSSAKADGSLPALRASAIRGLARTESGSRELLRWAREGGLEEPARTTASLALAQSRWSDVRTEAAGILPPPRTVDGSELPSVAELIGLRGDAVKGKAVFFGEKAACAKCHRVDDAGLEFGPALSQIGTKLGRQALYEAILDPSSGISFGYEAWSVSTRDGEEVFGLLASETEDEIAIRQQGGAVIRLKRSEIAGKDRQKLSIMPAGLGSLLSRQELVDLVEYLVTLVVPEAKAR